MDWSRFWENIFYSSIVLIIFVIIGISLMQVAYHKNLKKKKQFYAKLQNEIKVGNKVTFNNGIYGIIKRLDEATADIQVKSGAIITISRFIISSVEE